MFFQPLRSFLTGSSLLCAALLGQSVSAQTCEAHGQGSSSDFLSEVFDLTDQRLIGWEDEVRLGLYGLGPLAFDRNFQTHVRSMREVTGLDIALAGNGGAVDVAVVYANFRTLDQDAELAPLVTVLMGQNADLFGPDGALMADPDGYHYHFLLSPDERHIGLAAIFIDKRRYGRDQVASLLPKALNDALLVGGTSDALSPSLRNGPEAVLAYLEDCPRLPRVDLSLLDMAYAPRVAASLDQIDAESLNAQPLEIFR